MLAGSSSKSSKPAIFGAAPAPDDGGPRRPLGSAREGDAGALEVAAAEMAQSAATLVAIERTIMALSEKGVRCYLGNNLAHHQQLPVTDFLRDQHVFSEKAQSVRLPYCSIW